MKHDLNKYTAPGNLLKKISHNCFKNFIIQVFKTLNPNNKFIDNWHIDLIVCYLNSITKSSLRRLVINIPPRSLKSTIISVAWPAWLLGMEPGKRIIVASYSQSLSQKHSEDCRLIIQSIWYKKLFPNTKIRRGSNSKNKFITNQNGFRFATSIGGTLTGEGADILIVDDPHTPLQAESDSERTRVLNWFDQTFSTRLNDKKNGAIIIVMQRLHINDLSGHLLLKKNWQHLNLPAVIEDDIDYRYGNFYYKRKAGEFLNSRCEGALEIQTAKLELGSYGFNAQYLQQPINILGGVIKYHWIQKFDKQPSDFEAIYQSWDCAVKVKLNNDYSVCTTWGVKDNKYYLIDVIREKFEFPELKEVLLKAYSNYKPNAILIEDKASGQALIQELRTSTPLEIIAINPTKDKFVRLLSISSIFETGKIFIANSHSWQAEYIKELTNFPNTEHDDMVDSTTQFLEWIRSKYSVSPLKLRLM